MSSVDYQIKNALRKNELMDIWQEDTHNRHYIHSTESIYVTLTILQNAITNAGEQDLCAVLKFGQTCVGSSSVYERLKNQFNEYDAVWTEPILVATGNNPANIESILKKELVDYKVKIVCSKETNYKQPHEFFAVDQKIVNYIKEVCKYYNYNVLIDEDCDLDTEHENKYGILPYDYFDGTPIEFLDETDSLTSEQKRYIRQNIN